MSSVCKVMCLVGTRPEAIKMAPVIVQLKKSQKLKPITVFTGQHQDMAVSTLACFGLKADYLCENLTKNVSMPDMIVELMQRLDKAIKDIQPDVILVQGDTNSVMVASMLAFYHGIKLGHVEAGLRTNDLYQPFPEEFNRRVATIIAQWHFAPTEETANNLIKEGVSRDAVYITGNTVIDALYYITKKKVEQGRFSKKSILVTVHRRENFGQPMLDICHAIKEIAQNYSDIEINFPVHPNPNVRNTVYELLSEENNINLLEPLGYVDFCRYLKNSYLVLSDSGGVQEEAPALAKPVLVLRNTTERPDAVTAGCAKLIGNERKSIIKQVSLLLDDDTEYANMAKGLSPYGDGYAAKRIVDLIEKTV